MAYNNFSISSSKAKFYLKSKEPKEGFIAVPYGEGKTTYHQYYDRVEGILSKVETKDVDAGGKKLQFFEVTLTKGQDTNRISAPLKNSKGNYTDEVKALVSTLNSAEPGQLVSVSLNNKTTSKDGKDYENLSVYINYAERLGENGKPESSGFISFSEIPRAVKEEDEDIGVTWNWKPVNKFYAAKIKEIVARFEESEPVLSAAGVGDDDLPF